MNIEQAGVYNKLPENSEVVEKYKPKFLARGGDHLVYEADGHPDIVIKASSFVIKDALCDSEKSGIGLGSLSEVQVYKYNEAIKSKTKQAIRLREYFGTEHTINERRYFMKVPVTIDLLSKIFEGDWKNRQVPDGAEKLNEVWTNVIVQERVPEISDPEHLGFYFGGFLEERTDLDSEEYKRLNDSFVKLNSQTKEDFDRFFRMQDNPDTHALADLIEKIKNDNSLKDVVCDFIKKVINYAEETGNILALGGEDNVIFSEKDGKWNYILIDALPIHDEPVLSTAKEALHKAIDGKEIENYEKTLIMKALNFVRTVNSFAIQLGLSERLIMIDDKDNTEDINFASIFKK